MDILSYSNGKTPKWHKHRENEWSENLDGFSSSGRNYDGKGSVYEYLCWDAFEMPVLLVLIGVSSALVSYLTSLVNDTGNAIRDQIIGEDQILSLHNWAVYCVYATMMALLSCFVAHVVCKESVGGGLPDMKTILGGVVKPVLLSKRLIVAKTVGLWLALLGGLSVGREGPFVQISGAIADNLMRLPMFLHLRNQDSKRLEVISCACASGVSASFGNAFGGVLFSIEFTASAYMVQTLPKAFLTSVCAMLFFLLLGVSDQLALFRDSAGGVMTMNMPDRREMMAFVCIGLIGAGLGVIFVYTVELLSNLRNALLDDPQLSKRESAMRRYVMVGAVALVVSALMYYELIRMPHNSRGPTAVIQLLLEERAFDPDLTKYLVYFFVYKFVVTALSVTLPLPVGLFTPVFMTGAILGRVIGEVVKRHIGFGNYQPWEYTILGAAAFSTGVTRGISTAVIIFELSGHPHLGLPVAVVVLTAYFVGNLLSKNVYDVLIDASGRPYMEELPAQLNSVPVSAVMMPVHDYHVLALNSTYEDALRLLDATESNVRGLKSVSSDGIFVDMDQQARKQQHPHHTNHQQQHQQYEPRQRAGKRWDGVASNDSDDSDDSDDSSGSDFSAHHPRSSLLETQGTGIELLAKRSKSLPTRSRSRSNGLSPPNPGDRRGPSLAPSRHSVDSQFGSSPRTSERTPFYQHYHTYQTTLGDEGTSGGLEHGYGHGQSKQRPRPLRFSMTSKAQVRKFYAPNVIPVVQSRGSMVIVGAVLREDLRAALYKILKISQFALMRPVVLGRSTDRLNEWGRRMHTPASASASLHSSFPFALSDSSTRHLDRELDVDHDIETSAAMCDRYTRLDASSALSSHSGDYKDVRAYGDYGDYVGSHAENNEVGIRHTPASTASGLRRQSHRALGQGYHELSRVPSAALGGDGELAGATPPTSSSSAAPAVVVSPSATAAAAAAFVDLSTGSVSEKGGWGASGMSEDELLAFRRSRSMEDLQRVLGEDLGPLAGTLGSFTAYTLPHAQQPLHPYPALLGVGGGGSRRGSRRGSRQSLGEGLSHDLLGDNQGLEQQVRSSHSHSHIRSRSNSAAGVLQSVQEDAASPSRSPLHLQSSQRLRQEQASSDKDLHSLDRQHQQQSQLLPQEGPAAAHNHRQFPHPHHPHPLSRDEHLPSHPWGQTGSRTSGSRAGSRTGGSRAGSSLSPIPTEVDHLQEVIRYIIVTDGGRRIVPVVNAADDEAGTGADAAESGSQWFHAHTLSSLPLAIPIDPSPYQIVDTMELQKVDKVFRLLSLNQAYVTNSGRVVGLVTRTLLREFIEPVALGPIERLHTFLLMCFRQIAGS